MGLSLKKVKAENSEIKILKFLKFFKNLNLIGDTGKYNITGDTYSCDVLQKKWKKLNPTG